MSHFSPIVFLVCQDGFLLFDFVFVFSEKGIEKGEEKKQPNQSLILFVHRIEPLLSSVVLFFSDLVKGLFPFSI